MTKRILSIFVANIMIVSCFAFAASAEEDARYEGIKYFQSAEDMLTDLNDDSAEANDGMWDYEDRLEQQTVIDSAADAFDADFEGADLVTKWADYCARILTRDSDGNIINYFKMLDIFKTDDSALTSELLAVKNEFSSRHSAPEYDVTGLSLKDSFDKLDDYTKQMGLTISHHRTALNNYTLSEEKKTEYILNGTKALYQIAFQKTGLDMRDAFDDEFLGDDEGKKIIAVMYGKTLTSELAKDNISTILIGYINKNLAPVKNEFGELVKADCGNSTEAEVFDFLKNSVVKAYTASTTASDEAKADIKMLFGDPGVSNDKGALQLMFETMESSTANKYGMINTWFNLFLRQHVQTSFTGTAATTLEAGVIVEKKRLRVESGSAVFKIENLDRYGISADTSFLALGSDFLDLVCYNEDHTYNSKVIYNPATGKINISYDPKKDDTYPAYIQLIRNDGTYIETYPVLIENKKTSGPSSGGGGGGIGGGSGGTAAPTIRVSYESNDGTKYAADYYYEGASPEFTKVPVKPGSIFEGWYLDAECTQPVAGIVLTEDIVIYAKWVTDNGIAGGYQPVPDELNGTDHFAYVIGYPDNTVRPENNITRAEVAAIFFRLLKADVREANIAETNAFVDVPENEWYNIAVSTLTKLGIINGRTETEFVPNASITRAEFATICARFEDSEYAVTDNFTDISGHWAELYVREAAARGWIKGYEDGTFRPERLITRAESMTLINRILNRAPETEADLHADMVNWIDNNSTSWYYLAVQEATNSHSYEKKNNVYEKWTEIKEGTDWTQYQ